jgi:hypothetical protein
MTPRPRVLALLSAVAVLLVTGHAGAVPKPVASRVTMFMHGKSTLGEQDAAAWLATLKFTKTSPFTLDTKKPKGSQAKSMGYASLLNDQCSGTPVYPTFEGPLVGTVTSLPELDLHLVGAPGRLRAQVWIDTPMYMCNLEYVPPVATVDFDVPAGQTRVKVKFPKMSKRRTAKKQILVMILAPTVPAYSGQQGRLQYDAVGAASSMSFVCLPPAGRRTCA